jgi:uncharacterized delta-60 repeat protein
MRAQASQPVAPLQPMKNPHAWVQVAASDRAFSSETARVFRNLKVAVSSVRFHNPSCSMKTSRRFSCVLVLCAFANLLPFTVRAQTYTILHTFGTNVMGQYPHSALVQGPDGTLYGTASAGGVANIGQVFKVNPDGTGYTALRDFSGLDGAWPEAGLVMSGSTLYGTTAGGGTNDNGIVFKLNTDGTGFAVICQFADWVNGANPRGLILSGSTLYGTTEGGGLGNGTVFKVEVDGSGFSLLKRFTVDDGISPRGPLVLSGTELVGTTESGGRGYGTIFKINTDGSGFAVLKNFVDSDNEGASPRCGLLLSGSALFGTTMWGGSSGSGTLFKMNTDGTGFAVLKDFNYGEANELKGDLTILGATLYGTSSRGGSWGWGTIFKLNTDGTDFAVLKEFAGETSGRIPYAGLLVSGSTLYATTSEGGAYEYGTVFRIEADGSGYTVLTNFAGGDGGNPCGGVVVAGTNMFGVTAHGGRAGLGAVFRVNLDGRGYSLVKEFTNRLDGVEPMSPLLLADATLYGVATYGGSNNAGTVFKLNTDGSGFEVLKHLGGADGIEPYGGLVLSDSTLFGTTTSGGSSGNGTVFSVRTDGSDYRVLKNFSESDGAIPLARLLLVGNNLFGTTGWGGAASRGTVFRLNTDGSDFAVVKHFDLSDGGHPQAGLIWSEGLLYGVAQSGGDFGGGVLFKLTADGSAFVVLKHFGSGNEGYYPAGDLLLSGTTLYGTTTSGGNTGDGTVFQIETNGTGYVILKHFTYTDGVGPGRGTLALAGTTLYGTSQEGGDLGQGVCYSLSLVAGPPQIQLQPESQTIDYGFPVFLQVIVGGLGAPAYQWLFNGNPVEGATNYNLGIASMQRTNSGEYFVVVTNNYGSVTSEVATLTVRDPYLYSGSSSAVLLAGENTAFGVDAGGSPPLSFQWYKNGVVVNDGETVLGAQTATLTLTNVTGGDSGQYFCVVSNNYGTVTGPINLLQVRDPYILAQPRTLTASSGETVKLESEAGGSAPVNFQWFKDGLRLDDGANISGARSPMLTLSNVAGADAANYSLVVSNMFGGLSNLLASLSVIDPFITSQPLAQTISLWQPVNFGVVAGGTPPFSYQWRKNGNSLATQTNNHLFFAAVQCSDAGNYDVIVSNANGSITSQLARLIVNIAVADSFDPQPNFWVSTLAVQRDNRIVAGGGFNSLGGQIHVALGRVNVDGTVDQGFAPALDPNALALSIALQPDGRILIGGDFTVHRGLIPKNIGRFLSDGTVDNTFNPSANGWVNSVTTQPDGKILVGGNYVILNGNPRPGIGRLNLDGTLDESFNPILEGVTQCLAVQADGKIIAAGEFSSLDSHPYHNVVVRLNADGTRDTSFTPPTHPANSAAYALALQPDGKILIGGWPVFEQGGEMRANLARLNADGTLDLLFKATFDSGTGCVAVQADGKIVVGGGYSMVNGQRRDHLARLNADGSLDDTFNPGVNGNVTALLVQSDGAIVVGGGFTVLAGQPRRYLGRLIVYDAPNIIVPPQSMTAEVGASATFAVRVNGFAPQSFQWMLDGTNVLDGCTNTVLRLSELQFTHTGAYSVAITNAIGGVTSAPALLNVIPAVTRRPVPAINLLGEAGSFLTLEYANELSPAPVWLALDSVSLNSTSEWYFDLSAPLSTQRFYRARQTGGPTVAPTLRLPSMVPAITLTGSLGDKIRVDGINQFGPTDAWYTLDTVTLTNTSQLYFDVTAPSQPQRLYRLVPVP